MSLKHSIAVRIDTAYINVSNVTKQVRESYHCSYLSTPKSDYDVAIVQFVLIFHKIIAFEVFVDGNIFKSRARARSSLPFSFVCDT